jgi:hypothetical protein
MKKNDKGMGELLELLKTQPQLMCALVFDPESIKRLLGTKLARRLVLGVDTKAFLSYVSGPKDGGPIALCRAATKVLCPKRTRYPLCLGNTRPTVR